MQPTDAPINNDETPVSAEENLLRRSPNSPDYFNYKENRALAVAFLPQEHDFDGLSLNREGELFESAESVLEKALNENTKKNGGVFAVQCRDVIGLGLTAKPSPCPESRGHIVIPELNRRDYDKKADTGTPSEKQKIKALADKLARLSTVRIRPKPKISANS